VWVLVGELTLDGRAPAVPGVLPMTMAAQARGMWCVVVPEPQAGEAAMVAGMTVIGVRSLRQVVAHLRGQEIPEAPPVEPIASTRVLSWRGDHRTADPTWPTWLGMADARYALEVTAAGGHHLMLERPQGGRQDDAGRAPPRAAA
jgi:magnesium chelatase family protein